jgi:two-component system sensor histidine kinase KdpD
MIARRDQRLTLEEPLDLPTLRVDPTRTIQMIVNLLSNASKYSPVGSVIEISVEQANEGDPLRISIADRGRGINPGTQTSIFRPFVRLEPESQTDHGSGIGLSVVKAIAEAHQGQVGVEARSGGGSVFWFTLPILETQETQETNDMKETKR